MLLQQFGDDFVAVLQFFLKLPDFLFVRVLLPFHVGLVRPPHEGALAVLEELLLPLVVLRGVDPVLVAQIRYRQLSIKWRRTIATFCSGVNCLRLDIVTSSE